ncbi:MAG: O-antigen ligase family protein [Candidatus Eremiobacteraeota bacterium]|nr:O-antigen ligase family protein [Candidatus Eremiobacteraeota bacterium]
MTKSRALQPTGNITIWISLGILTFAGIAWLGFDLAMGNVGCRVLWGLVAPYCGQKTGIAMAICLFVVPFAVYLAIKRPWIFPVALYAFLVPSDSYLNLTSAGSITKLAGILATGAIVLYLARNRRFVRPGVSTVIWLAYLTYSSITLFWAYNVDNSTLQLWTTFIQLVLFYVIISSAQIDEDDFRLLLFAFIVGCMGASLFGAHAFAQGGNHIVNQGRLKAKFGGDNKLQSDVFSASLVFPIGIVVMNALRTRWSLKKIGYMGAFGVLLIGQFVVGSRGGFLADGVTMLYYFWKSRYKAQLTTVAVTALLFSFIYPNALWARFFSPEKSAGGSGRAEIWKVGLAAWKHYWLLGAGFANFPDVYNQYYLLVWNAFAANWSRAPHNIILEAAVEIGVFGVFLLLMGWWTTFRSLRHISKHSRLYDFRVTLEGGVLGTFVAAIFVFIIF